MTENFLFSLNIVAPSFVMIFLGWLAVRLHQIERATMERISRLSFRYFLSVKIFLEIAREDFRAFSNLSAPLYCLAVTVVLFAATWFLAARFMKRKESVGAFVHACFRGSVSVFGIAMAENLAGAAGATKMACVIVACSLLYGVLAALCLSGNQAQKAGKLINGRFFLDIISNPLIIASLLGLAASFFRVRFPALIMQPLQSLSSLAVPLALLGIGAALQTKRQSGTVKYPLMAALIKTFVMPAIGVPLAVLLGFRGLDLSIIGITLSLANPSTCYVVTVAMHGDGVLAARATAFSTLLSAASVTVLLFLLKTMALI